MSSLPGDQWMLLAIAAPALWAASCVADVCLVGIRAFERATDGVVVSSIACLLPLTLLLPGAAVDAELVELDISALGAALAAAVLFFVYLYLYFRALFQLNDASCAEVFGTLTVVIVPVFAWALLDEELAARHYVGIALAAVGALVLVGGYLGGASRKAVVLLSMAITSLSLSVVAQAHALSTLGYAPAMAVFFAVQVLLGAALFAWRRADQARLRSLAVRYGLLFVALEVAGQLAVMSSQRAVLLSPSVSLVAIFECLLPVFVLVFSAVLVMVRSLRLRLSSEAVAALRAQNTALGTKGVSLGLIGAAVLLAGS